MLQCKGFENQDFDSKLDILTENRDIQVNTILKTSSGFGGFNASVIIQKIWQKFCLINSALQWR